MRFIERLKAPFSERRRIIESYKKEFEAYGDEHLRHICRAALSPELRKAAACVLRERGSEK